MTAASSTNISLQYDLYLPAVDVTTTVLSRTNLLTGTWQSATGLTTTVVSDDGTNQTLRIDRVPAEETLFLRLQQEYTP
jgi:hypothetical protein